MNTLGPMKIQQASDFGRVGLVVGGDSAERQVSLNGGAAVGAALARKGVDVRTFDGAMELFEAIGRGEIDRVFNLIHGPDGEDGSLQGALQLMNVPVTGSNLPAPAGNSAALGDGRSVPVTQRARKKAPVRRPGP